jgi:tripeptidyl-peptidase-1
LEWLETAGIADRVSVSANKQWLQFDATTSEAEELFKTKYHIYEHSNGKTTIGCDEYSVPEHIRPHVDYITPGIKLLETKVQKPAHKEITRRSWHKDTVTPLPPLSLSNLTSMLKEPLKKLCQTIITPKCISTLYNIPKADKAAPGNEMGIFEDIGDVYSQEDMDLFWQYLYPKIPNGTHPKLDSIDGAVAPVPVADAGSESNLDFQTAYPIVYPQKFILFQTDDPVYQANYTYAGFLNNFLDAIDGSYCQLLKPI